jgi:adenylate cyclase
MYEIERKFLVNKEKWSPVNTGVRIIQGYLSTDLEHTIRVRIAGEKAFLTIKGKSVGIKRIEMEYEIPVPEAEVLLKMCKDTPVEKTRYYEKKGDVIWEIDVFKGENSGLFLAEVELENETQKVDLPDWIEKEVSDNPRYFNSYLTQHPFLTWL